MEYKKIIKLLDNTLNQPSKFRTKNWVEINYDSHLKYSTVFKSKLRLMLKSNLCDYNYAYVHKSDRIIIT